MTEKKQKPARKKRAKRARTETTERIGSRIKMLRLSRKMTQAAVAEASGTSSKYLGEVERGEANISIELIGRIAATLSVPMSDILENEHERPHEELIAEIIRLAPRLSDKDAQIAFRMIKMLTE